MALREALWWMERQGVSELLKGKLKLAETNEVARQKSWRDFG